MGELKFLAFLANFAPPPPSALTLSHDRGRGEDSALWSSYSLLLLPLLLSPRKMGGDGRKDAFLSTEVISEKRRRRRRGRPFFGQENERRT